MSKNTCKVIHYSFKKALNQIKVEVSSSTHFLRHSAIQHLRDATNNLDLTHAFSLHTDRRTVEKTYGKQPVDANKKATDTFSEVFKNAHQDWLKTGTGGHYGATEKPESSNILELKRF